MVVPGAKTANSLTSPPSVFTGSSFATRPLNVAPSSEDSVFTSSAPTVSVGDLVCVTGKVDEYLQTSAPHVFAAGDVIGHLMLVPEAMQDGFVAATNAVRGPIMPVGNRVSPTGSFTDPEYAQVGLTEANARRTQDVVTAVVRFDSTTRTIIDGHKVGFCKLIADRKTSKILGCHVVGERAVDIVQVAAIAIAGGMRVEDLARVPLSFPTYAGILVNAAAGAARQLGLTVMWQTLEGGTGVASQATRKTKEVA